MRKLLGPDVAIIGVGGVDSAETALEKIRAGADLVQLYTGMIYAGPALPGRIVKGLSRFLDKEGLRSLAEIRDSRVDPVGGQAALGCATFGRSRPQHRRRTRRNTAAQVTAFASDGILCDVWNVLAVFQRSEMPCN